MTTRLTERKGISTSIRVRVMFRVTVMITRLPKNKDRKIDLV